MIDLYYWPTPNGRKISILLEELHVPYKIINIDITNNEQFSKNFSNISPSNKIPAIFDNENNQSIFESGAIMLYLANKHNQFLPKKYYWEIMEWFIFQISQVGPTFGQAHQFLYYNSGKSKYAEDKYKNYVKRIYQTIEDRLKKREYLGNVYSIADIATWPWVARFEKHCIKIQNYPNTFNWFKSILKRPAVIKGYNPGEYKEELPLI